MQVDWTFPRRIFIAIIIICLAGGYPLWVYGTYEISKAVFAGAILATVNVLLGYAAIEYSLRKSTTTFFKVVLGGMGLRLLMMAVVLVILIKFFKYHVGALIGSLGLFYVVFLFLEVTYINKKITVKQQL